MNKSIEARSPPEQIPGDRRDLADVIYVWGDDCRANRS
jgi:hypothetical protein